MIGAAVYGFLLFAFLFIVALCAICGKGPFELMDEVWKDEDKP